METITFSAIPITFLVYCIFFCSAFVVLLMIIALIILNLAFIDCLCGANLKEKFSELLVKTKIFRNKLTKRVEELMDKWDEICIKEDEENDIFESNNVLEDLKELEKESTGGCSEENCTENDMEPDNCSDSDPSPELVCSVDSDDTESMDSDASEDCMDSKDSEDSKDCMDEDKG